jgi:hypothetical protein
MFAGDMIINEENHLGIHKKILKLMNGLIKDTGCKKNTQKQFLCSTSEYMNTKM